MTKYQILLCFEEENMLYTRFLIWCQHYIKKNEKAAFFFEK